MHDAGRQGADSGGFLLLDILFALDLAAALALFEFQRQALQRLGKLAEFVAATGQIAVMQIRGQALALDHGGRLQLQALQIPAYRLQKAAAGNTDCQ